MNLLDRIQKIAAQFDELVKFEPDLMASLKVLEEAAKAHGVDPSHIANVRTHLATDKLLRDHGVLMGNRAAYNSFLNKTREGVHIHLDGNGFGQINKLHGFEAGDQAIVAYGKAIREAIDESVGRSKAKAHRVGGDEFRVFTPTYEDASRFARSLRSKLEAVAPIGGTHSLSVSMGFGPSQHHAEIALINAKEAKKKARYPTGQEKTHAYSMMPHNQGHIPVDNESVQGVTGVAQQS